MDHQKIGSKIPKTCDNCNVLQQKIETLEKMLKINAKRICYLQEELKLYKNRGN